MKIKVVDTVLFYDYTQVFIGESEDGAIFACFIFEEKEDGHIYLAANITPKEASEFSKGEIDLFSIFEIASGNGKEFDLVKATEEGFALTGEKRPFIVST